MSRRPFRSRCQRVGQVVVSLTLATLTMGFLGVWPAQTLAADKLDRTVLPIPEPKVVSITELDARNAKAPPRFEVKAPKDAPNVVIVLIDDIGFGHSSAFGGPIHMPTLEKMAANGLKYNRFHTTALCSPTRVALLTGRNHHVNNAGAIMELATAFPRQHRRAASERDAAGRDSAPERIQHRGLRQVPRDRAVGSLRVRPVRPLADRFGLRQVLRLHRRRDQPVGAGHLRWHGAHRDAAHAGLSLHHGHDGSGDQMGERQQTLTPDKPFYMYFATGATHAPHHVPKEWIEKYKGQFAGGWDKLREETFARQKKTGRDPRRCQADAAAQGDPRLGRHERRPEAALRAPDGNVRRLRRTHRS